MKEQLVDIVDALDSCATARKGTGIAPLARVRCLYDGVEETFWFTTDLVKLHGLDELQTFGRFVPKYSQVAIQLQQMAVGTSFEYVQPDYIKKKRLYHVVLENRSVFLNQEIEIAGDPITYQYRNLHEFLTALQRNHDEIVEIQSKIAELEVITKELKSQKNTSHKRSQITRTINDLRQEYRILTQQQEELKNITNYIRKQGEMRYAQIVDPIQTRIQSQNLFDGKTIIINGGPGTGKSTTMIHRLAYLTSKYAINEDKDKQIFNYKLTPSQRKQLIDAIDENRDWMFFSPSQLLKNYLSDAMKKEGLADTNQKVWNWRDYCRYVLEQHYCLLETQTSKAPFKICYLTDTLFYQNSGIVDEWINFYLGQFRQIKNELPPYSANGVVYEWISIAKGILNKLDGSENFDLAHFIMLFNSLESVYGDDCRRLIQVNNSEITTTTNELRAILEKNKDVKSELEVLLDIGLSDELDDQTNENIEEKSKPADIFSIEVRKWLKSYSYHKINENAKLSDEYQMMADIILPLLDSQYENRFIRIGELTAFEQYARYTRGVGSIMLKGIDKRYLKFREHLIRTKFQGCNLKLLVDIRQRGNSKELHFQEQSLLLGFINTLVKKIKATGIKIKHEYVDAYDELSRPIIGIDEATDFSACDIYAIQSLLFRDYYSLTLCGDMMQRLTGSGITSWSELDTIVPNPVVVEMKTSYRQSKRLLEVARQLYVDTIDEIPQYKAYMKSERVPLPLAYVDDNELSKIQWISKRIGEVYLAYGEQLPSIAIFVNDKGYIRDFIIHLQNTDFFREKGIKVLDGTGDTHTSLENHICVYSIDVVKGMEFDVVFFHNIDNSSVDDELLKRYIYVGVSRAAFFLAVTMSERHDEICKYFVENRDWFKI